MGQEQTISVSVKGKTVQEALGKIESDLDISFFYRTNDSFLKNKVNVELKGMQLEKALGVLFENTCYSFTCFDRYVAISKKADYRSSRRKYAHEEIKVSGKVQSLNGEPIFGVNVYDVKNPSKGVISKFDGSYEILLDDDDTKLCFSFIGFKEVIIDAKNKHVLNITLEEKNEFIPEIMVIGYGSLLKANVIGAVSQVTSQTFENNSLHNVTQALQGTAANLIVQEVNSEPGSLSNLNIRGISTINNNSPLVVVDGIIGGNLDMLNPNDVESVSILKDAGSAAIYGSRSANGVILVTTKKGIKNTATQVKFSSQLGVQTPNILFNPVAGYKNAMLRNEASQNSGNHILFEAEEIQLMKELGDNEWIFNSITQNNIKQNHNLSVSGGNANTTYLISLGYFNEESLFVGPDYGLERKNFRTNVTSEYGKLKLSANLSYVLSNLKSPTFYSGFLIADASRTPIDYRYKLQDNNGRYLVNDVLSQFNPLGILEKGGESNSDNDNIVLNFSAEFALNKNLKLKGVFGADVNANHTKSFVNQVLFYANENATERSGIYGADLNADDLNEKIRFYNTQVMLKYVGQLNEADVDGMLGGSNESFSREAQSLHMKYTDPDLHIPTSETVISKYSLLSPQTLNERSLNSLFGRIGYSFKNKYLLKGNFRFDGTSRFGKDYRWGFFPSALVGWRVSEEAFFAAHKEKISDLKLRLSYGLLGNQNVNDYIYYDAYTLHNSVYGFNNSDVSGAQLQIGNERIDWEVSRNLNVGADFTILKGDLSVTVDYFNTRINNILLTPVVPGTFGGSISAYNTGRMKSEGWELSLNYHFTKNKFKHFVKMNIADSWNKVIDFDDNRRIESFDEMQRITMEGIAINSYYGYKTDGFFQNETEVNKGAKPVGAVVAPGDIRYKDKNEDGIIDDKDRYVLGNAFPRLTFGLTYNLQWKNFDCSLLVQGVGKRKMFLRGELVEPFHGAYSYTMYKHQLDFWTPDNRNARYPRLTTHGSSSSANNYGYSSDFYIYDASYIRLKNVQIGYAIPQKIGKKIGTKKARIFVDMQNLVTLSYLDFVNPEITEFDNNMNNTAANSGRNYPTPKYFGLGVEVTF